MQHPPIIKNQHTPRPQLLPVLIRLRLEQRVKLARSRIPRPNLLNLQLDTRSVRRVPAHTQQLPRRGIVLKHGEPAVRLDRDALVARRVRVHVDGCQEIVCRGVGVGQLVRGAEAVDEQRGAAGAVRVRKEVERLQAGWVGKVRVVGVCFERNVGVCCVL
jgi:hypothetical protein